MLPRLSLLLLALFSAAALQAQPLVDGITVGGGVSIYQGDLDYNADNGPVEFLSFGSPSVFVAADRSFGRFVAEASVQLDRHAIESEFIDMGLLTTSLNLTGGVRLDVYEPGFLRPYGGVAPMLVSPSYDRVDEAMGDYDFERQGTHLVWTFPVGVVVQDVLRLGFRFVAGDDLDSTAGHTGANDFMTSFSVGYRIDLLR